MSGAKGSGSEKRGSRRDKSLRASGVAQVAREKNFQSRVTVGD